MEEESRGSREEEGLDEGKIKEREEKYDKRKHGERVLSGEGGREKQIEQEEGRRGGNKKNRNVMVREMRRKSSGNECRRGKRKEMGK